MPIRQKIIAAEQEQPRTFVALPKNIFERSDRNDDDRYVRLASRKIYGGHDPRTVPVQDLLRMAKTPVDPNDQIMTRYQRRISSPLTAIRAMCINCAGGPGAVRSCEAVDCPLWPFRMGSNPFFGKMTEKLDNE